ncbi:MAG: response regulator [Deltaproteobacteria bacterium]|nr:response regulator [Deltaproteobacteria bacterium]
MNILLVDDEMDQLQSLRIGLRAKGHHVLETSSAEEAIRYLANNEMEVHLVITDYLLPGMNGLDVVKAIRKNNKILPIILMTAYGENNLFIEAFRSGCDSYIEKPFAMDELMGEIERVKTGATCERGHLRTPDSRWKR